MAFKNAPAFRCRKCGHLEGADHAGEHARPHACSCCGAGVTFTPQGIKTIQPDNWEVLIELPPEDLARHGLTPADVAKHVPHSKVKPGRPPQAIQAEATDKAASHDEA